MAAAGPERLPAPEAPRGRAPVSAIIERMGAGPAQLKFALLSGPVWLADGSEILLISSVTQTVAEEWQLGHFQRGFVVSLAFIGTFIGNILGGPMGDSLGRRLPILLSFACIFVFSVLSALSWGFWSLGACRLLVGMSFGIGQPAQHSLTIETAPAAWRVIFGSFGTICFCLGELYSGFLLLLDDPYLQKLRWRLLIVLGALPAAVFGTLALLFLNQSPLYLACGGRYDETRAVLESMRRDNSAPDVCIDFKPHRALCGASAVRTALGRQLEVVFGRELRTTSCILIYSCFVLNFTYYGTLYAFPQVMTSVSMGGTPAGNLLVGAVLELLGVGMGVVCILYLARKPVMRLFMLIMSVSLVVFGAAGPSSQSSSLLRTVLFASYYGFKFTVLSAFLVVYLYAAEVYPTVARNTGTAVAFAGGRVASMLAPVVYEEVASATGGFAVFFYGLAALTALNVVLIWFLPRETVGQPLREGLEDCAEAGTSEAAYGAAQRGGAGV